jgi:hypothetical protein
MNPPVRMECGECRCLLQAVQRLLAGSGFIKASPTATKAARAYTGLSYEPSASIPGVFSRSLVSPLSTGWLEPPGPQRGFEIVGERTQVRRPV